jgi:hypothetical protein
MRRTRIEYRHRIFPIWPMDELARERLLYPETRKQAGKRDYRNLEAAYYAIKPGGAVASAWTK